MIRCIRGLLILIFIFPVLFLSAAAQPQIAEDITAAAVLSGGGLDDHGFLTDGNHKECWFIGEDLLIQHNAGIASLTLAFDQPCGYRIYDPENGVAMAGGNNGFLHCFSDIEGTFGYVPKKIGIEFPTSAMVSEIRVYSSGQLPDTVQQWEAPLTGGADMVLFSTHGDDEQLYFAGLLPYYAGELGLGVQVVYMTGHSDICGSERMHEMLDGLWAVGVTSYPIFGPFPDFKILNREGTYYEYQRLGYSREELLEFVVENIRRFRPLVAIGHDLNGEYGHGMHMVYSHLLTQAVEVSGNPEIFPESASAYGAWDVPKTYLHLYAQNPIVMDWDRPLNSFDGMTAFEVNQKLGFPCHVSQQYDQYVHWLYGYDGSLTRASDIVYYSPCLYGLYRSAVGADLQKNDMMENLLSYGEQTRQHEEQTEQLRSVIELARREQVQQPKLLRQPDVTEPVAPIPENPYFPVAAVWLAVLSGCAVLALLFGKNFFEKK